MRRDRRIFIVEDLDFSLRKNSRKLREWWIERPETELDYSLSVPFLNENRRERNLREVQTVGNNLK